MQEGSFSFSSQNLLARLVAPVLGCLTAAVLGMVLVGDRENSLASFMNIVGIFSFFVGAVSPRVGLYLLVFFCAYLDFIKRFLIFFSSATMEDVINVLRVAPFTLVGILVGLAISYAFKRFQLKTRDWLLLGLVGLIEIAIVVSNVRTGAGITGAANSGVYVPLIMAIPLLFREVDEMLKFFRWVLAMFLPVALYGIWQGIFGLADFEYQYLLSGLTSTAANLDDLRPRPFSTLSSPHAFSVTMGICVVLSVTLSTKALRTTSGLWNSGLRMLLPIAFFVSSIISLGRSGWCVWFFGGIGAFAFKTGSRIVTFYSVLVLTFVMLVANAQFIYDHLENIQQVLPFDSEFSEQAFRVGTYSERLYGYMNIFTNKEMLTWFGNPVLQATLTTERQDTENRDEVVHDALGQVLLSYGVVGVFVTLLSTGTFLYWAHRHALHLPSARSRAFSTVLLSTMMGLIVSGMFTGSSIGIFPMNFLFWCIIGTMITVGRTLEDEAPVFARGLVHSRYQRKIIEPGMNTRERFATSG